VKKKHTVADLFNIIYSAYNSIEQIFSNIPIVTTFLLKKRNTTLNSLETLA
jgi:hypothetical protein